MFGRTNDKTVSTDKENGLNCYFRPQMVVTGAELNNLLQS